MASSATNSAVLRWVTAIAIWSTWSLASNGNEALLEAKATWNDASKRRTLTFQNANKHDFFPGSTELFRAGAKLPNVLRRKPIAEGIIPKVNGNDRGPLRKVPEGVEPGDVFLIKADPPMALLYVGESRFPNSSTTFPFFIYPYRSRLEFNTYPPRYHAELTEAMVGTPVLPKVFRIRDDRKRDAKWLSRRQGSKWYQYFTRGGHRGKRFVVYRYDGSPASVTLDVVVHKQVTDDSCPLAAYADLLTFYGRNTRGTTTAAAAQLESQLLKDEIDSPPQGTLAAKAMGFLDGVLDADEKKQVTELRQASASQNVGQEQLLAEEEKLKSEFESSRASRRRFRWLQFAYETRWIGEFGFSPLESPSTASDLSKLLEQHLQKDEPLLAIVRVQQDVSTGSIVGWTPSEIDVDGQPSKAQAIDIPQRQADVSDFGHTVLLTGVLAEKQTNNSILQIACTNPNSGEAGTFLVRTSEMFAAITAMRSRWVSIETAEDFPLPNLFVLPR